MKKITLLLMIAFIISCGVHSNRLQSIPKSPIQVPIQEIYFPIILTDRKERNTIFLPIVITKDNQQWMKR